MLEHLTMVGIEDLILAQAHEIERQRTSAHCLEKFKFGSCGATVVDLFVLDRESVLVKNDFLARLFLLQLKSPGDDFF